MFAPFRFNVVAVVLALLVALSAGAGCATERSRSATATTAPSARTADASQPRDKSRLTLDQIEPRLQLATAATDVVVATTAPASQPSRAPVDALNLYAQAVDALQAGRRFTAINLLEKALALDPQSFELNYALGKAHVIGKTHDEQSAAALARAAVIRPDHLEVQTDLGRQYLARGDHDKGMEHLRLAVQTTGYQNGDPGAAVADLFLARALQQGGYDRAALEQYGALLRRAQNLSHPISRDPHLAFLITDRLYVDIGDLYARNGQFADALAAFEPAARRDPSDFDLEKRVVRSLVGLGRDAEASRRAADAVVRFRASPPSLELLRDVHNIVGSKSKDVDGRGAADELARAHADRPNDTTVLFALVELLRGDGRWAEAEGYLAAAIERSPDDSVLVRRRAQLRMERDDPEGAARLLVETIAARPDLAPELDDAWEPLVSPTRPARLRLAEFQAMEVLPQHAAAKELGVASVAAALRRQPVAAQALERAVKLTPPFAPAFRARMTQIWTERDVDDAERTRRSDELIALAAASSASSADPSLAQELTGLSLLNQKKDPAAADSLGKAMAAGGRQSPSLLLSYAAAMRGTGERKKFEQLLWKLLSDRPGFEDAYSTLYAHYAEAGADAQADRVLSQWIVSLPQSPAARMLQAARQFRAGNTESARAAIARLVEDHGDDPGVLRTAYAFYVRSGKADELVAVLEKRLDAEPGNVAALNALVELYEEKGRVADAAGRVDAARTLLADDPEHLYQVAHLYVRVGQQQAHEDALGRVLELEPAHPPASNDLGYGWAERGANLAQAEALIRQAVAAEPANVSFLDSLGWVLYKRGKFAEARPSLEKAAADAARADPVVLDHLGDLLYRLGDTAAAAKMWEQAGAKLTEASDRDDLKKLKADLDRKTRQLKAGEPATVSPVIDESRQAKN